MRYVVTSDVHLGSEHCQVDLFNKFVTRLAPGIGLVLAGDVVDAPDRELNEPEAQALRALAERSESADVIWVNGNHDDQYRPDEHGRIEFHQVYTINDCLAVAHGDRFDNVMPYNRWFIRLFRFFHVLRIRLGANPVHVAVYAKRFRLLYAFLRNNVRRNAIEYAKERGIANVVCGHVHFAEECSGDGIRYFNLGAWTEARPHVLLVDGDSLDLVAIDTVMNRADWFTP